MADLNAEEKANLIQQRVKQYQVQRFNFEMDVAAYVATGNTKAKEQAEAEIARIDLASAAVASIDTGA